MADYVKGTYEAQLKSQGYDLAAVKSQYDYGANINPGEYRKITQNFESPLTKARNTALQNIQGVASQQYQFDPNQYLPGIKQQAESIYGPQQAQLEAIRLLQQSQYEDARITTAKDFEDTLRGEIESINRRGAYFSGGAIERERDINDTKLRALNQLGMQATAADFTNLAQQGLLAAEEAQFIQDRLYNAESSAYSRWMDQRNFSYQAAVQQYQIYTDERDFARNVFESDRAYNLGMEQFEMQKKEFEQTYKINELQFEKAKATFQYDIDTAKLTYEQALKKFKENTAVDNSGIFGLDDTNQDVEQGYWEGWQQQEVITDQYGQGVSQQSNVFDIDSYWNNNFGGGGTDASAAYNNLG